MILSPNLTYIIFKSFALFFLTASLFSCYELYEGKLPVPTRALSPEKIVNKSDLSNASVFIVNNTLYNTRGYKVQDITSSGFAFSKITSLTSNSKDAPDLIAYLHGVTVNPNRSLDLFYSRGLNPLHFDESHRVRNDGKELISAGTRRFELKEICDIASPSKYDSYETPILMTVRMCDVEDSNFCVGGVIDTTLSPRLSRSGAPKNWWIKSDQKGYFASLFSSGFYSDECMSIDVSRDDFLANRYANRRYAAVYDPSRGQISIYNAHDIREPVYRQIQLDPGKRMLDMSLEGYNRYSATDDATIVVLYQEKNKKYIDHYVIIDDRLSEIPFLTERVRDDAVKIEATTTIWHPQHDGHISVVGENGISIRNYKLTMKREAP